MADDPTAEETTTVEPSHEAATESAAGSTMPPDEGVPPDSPTQNVKAAEFASLKPTPSKAGPGGPMDRFYDVHVPVWAELGRVEVPLGELVKLDEGSVLMLDRPVSEPVDLVSQGIKLARGEVIVVDDCFAIRIKEIISNKS